VAVWYGIDPLVEKYSNVGGYVYCLGNPIKLIDPDGMDWIEGENGNITWNAKTTSKETTPKGYIYRGTSYQREKIWRDVNVRGNSETGLMQENYNPNGKMTYTNLTKWMDRAFSYIGTTEIKEKESQTDIQRWIDNMNSAYNLQGSNRPITSDNEPWCGVFIYGMLTESGTAVERGSSWQYPSLTTFYENNWENSTKLDSPKFGAVAKMQWSHVTFIYDFNDTHVWVLGGNQATDGAAVRDGVTVNIVRYPRSSIKSIMYPKE
jgi:hypothetical protein